MNKIKVLIADDIEVIAKSYKKVVENNEKIEVVGLANNGQQEYEMILELKPEIVITDNKMPILNGIDVIEKIHNSNIDNKPNFIIITGDIDYSLMKKCNELGNIRMLNKPVTDDKILYALDEIIENDLR